MSRIGIAMRKIGVHRAECDGDFGNFGTRINRRHSDVAVDGVLLSRSSPEGSQKSAGSQRSATVGNELISGVPSG